MLETPPNDAIRLREGSQRVFKTQLVLCLFIGISSFLLFCLMRYHWPHIYAVRTLRKRAIAIKPLPNKFFLWVWDVIRITDEEVLEYSGLDAYVFLTFFKMGVKIFLYLAAMATFILSPIRYYYTGKYDKDGISWFSMVSLVQADDNEVPDFSDDFPNFFWVYPIFTYIFSILVYVNVFDYTKRVLRMRQKYLASQDSVTDRTIRLDGIPRKLLKKGNPEVLKTFIENLGIGKVTDVKLIYNWGPLEEQFAIRKSLIQQLENLYAKAYGLNIDVYNSRVPSVYSRCFQEDVVPNLKKNDKIRHKIDKLSESLVKVDNEIKHIQGKFDSETATIDTKENPEFQELSSAFITMDSVASAQMAAQTVLDPRLYKLIATLAPAPKDIIWKNFKLTFLQRAFKSYLITLLMILSYAFIIFLVTPLTSLLDLKTITKVWPALGEFIGKSEWLTTLVTGILPPFLFSLLTISFPYFYKYLTKHQGYSSNSDVELSTFSKNFFFIFFNLFLVFIVTGTVWDYLSYISDTTKIAYQLARSLKNRSLFYVDLILLQGLAMFPVRLLQVSDFLILNILSKVFLLKRFIFRTPRDYRFYYYTPPIFDFGIQLPQHILIFIIILIYSVVSTKIVASGLVYFVLGYFVYKYQLVYNFVHPPHSTGKIWPMIFRRLMLGVVIFQLFMCGTLALEGAILLAILCSPLVMITLVITWNFEKYYLPLSSFIALRAIINPFDFDGEFGDDTSTSSAPDCLSESTEYPEHTFEDDHLDESSLLLGGIHSVSSRYVGLSRRRSTIDEERERFTDYKYPYLVDPLHGPWIGFEGDTITMVNYHDTHNQRRGYDGELENADLSIMSTNETEVVLRKTLSASEWE